MNQTKKKKKNIPLVFAMASRGSLTRKVISSAPSIRRLETVPYYLGKRTHLIRHGPDRFSLLCCVGKAVGGYKRTQPAPLYNWDGGGGKQKARLSFREIRKCGIVVYETLQFGKQPVHYSYVGGVFPGIITRHSLQRSQVVHMLGILSHPILAIS